VTKCSDNLAVCVEWCDMFVKRFGVGLFAFFFLLLNLNFYLLFNIITALLPDLFQKKMQ